MDFCLSTLYAFLNEWIDCDEILYRDILDLYYGQNIGKK